MKTRGRTTILATLPSQLLRIGRVMQEMGEDPRKTTIKRLFTGGEPAALLEVWRDMGQLGALTEQYCALLEIPDEHIRGELRTMLETQAGIADKDLSLALELGRTRPGAAGVLAAVRAAMPAVYNVHKNSEESQ